MLMVRAKRFCADIVSALLRWAMLTGVVFEVVALLAVIGRFINDAWWLPNFALAFATFGAVLVASKVAWDYQRRGLNNQQERSVAGMLQTAGLTEVQREAVARLLQTALLTEAQQETVEEIIEAKGLTDRQTRDLRSALVKVGAAVIIAAQDAYFRASSDWFLLGNVSSHGRLVAISHGPTYGVFHVTPVEPPPQPSGTGCRRTHSPGVSPGGTDVDVLMQLLMNAPYGSVPIFFLWRDPGDNTLRFTYRGMNNDSLDHPLVFNQQDCIPRYLDPQPGDYVLRGRSPVELGWVQEPSL